MKEHMVLALSGSNIAREAVFWILAAVATVAGIGMVLARRAVHCAVLLAVVMLSLAVLYALQGAPFLAFVQVIVYTGAVLMLFLFVLMIVGITSADSAVETIRGQRLAAAVAGIGLLVLLVLVIGHAAIGPAAPASASFSGSNITGLGTLIFTTYVFPFEVTSALLITAALGAMVLAHRERLTPKPTQRRQSRDRIASDHPTPMPGPGTYARHNAVDMPALLPDGSPSALSVSEVLTGPAADAPVGRTALPGLADNAGDSPEDDPGSPGPAVTVGGGSGPAPQHGSGEDA